MQLESIFSFVLPSFHPLDFFYSHKFQRKLQGICVYIYIYIYVYVYIYVCIYIYIYIYIIGISTPIMKICIMGVMVNFKALFNCYTVILCFCMRI